MEDAIKREYAEEIKKGETKELMVSRKEGVDLKLSRIINLIAREVLQEKVGDK